MDKIISSPLSDKQIKKYFRGNPNIVMMRDIATMTKLDEVFNGYDHAVIFTSVNSQYDGHWNMMYISGDNLYFFDSYGMKPTQLIQNIVAKGYPVYGQNQNLDNLIRNSKYFPHNCFMNNVKYQSDKENIQTCGRYIALNFILLQIYKKRKLEYSTENFYQIMKTWKNKFNKSYDYIVSFFIDDIVNSV